MKMDIRYASHPEDAMHYTTGELREKFLIEEVFVPDEANFTYSHIDRVIAGGIMPVKSGVKLKAGKELAAEYFLERREMGCINIGGTGVITIDGEKYDMNPRDGIFIGKGAKDVSF